MALKGAGLCIVQAYRVVLSHNYSCVFIANDGKTLLIIRQVKKKHTILQL